MKTLVENTFIHQHRATGLDRFLFTAVVIKERSKQYFTICVYTMSTQSGKSILS